VGTTQNELVGRPFQPPFSGGGGAAWKEYVRSLTPDNPTATIDCGMIMPDRGIQWYRWRGLTLCGADGKILEYQYLCFSIHECMMLKESLRQQRQSLEEQVNDRTAALRESEERFRAVFEESPIGIAFCDMEGVLVHANRAFLATFGVRSREDVEGWNAFYTQNIARNVLSGVQEGKSVRFTVPCVGTKNLHLNPGVTEGREKICLECTASPVFFEENGIPTGFVLQFCNVTGRENAGAVVREAESRYRNLLEMLAEGVVYMDPDGRIIDANPAAERILGYSLSDMQGRTCAELLCRVIGEDGTGHPEDLLPCMVALKTGIPERQTLGIFNPRERRFRWLDILASPRFRPGEAKPFQVVVVFFDITGQREGEEARLEAERRYRALTEALPDVVFMLDPGGRLLYVNSLGARLLHRLPEEIIGKNLTALFGDQGVQFHLNVASAIASGTIIDDISQLQLPDGEVWYDTRLIPVSAQDGTCRYVMGIGRDVTAQVRAEEVLHRNVERFRSVFNESPIGIAICDPDGQLLHVNPACLELFGIARTEEVLGTNILQIGRVTGNDDMQLPGNTVTRFECRIDFDRIRNAGILPTTRTGSIHIVSVVSPLRPQEGGSPDGYLIQIYDITAQVLAEGALRESHDRLAGIARHLPDAMFAIDWKGVVTVWNLAMEDLTGFSAEEMLGKGNYEYAIPFYGKRTPLIADKVLNPGEVLQNRYRSITYVEGRGITAETVVSLKDGGSPRIWWVKAAPLYDSKGEVAGAIESIRDVTEQRRGEELLKKEKMIATMTLGTP
jgi:PAS domain S-box-containing protein